MKRDLYNKLIEWKTSENRKPLVLEGARQVGKTWLLKQFGKTEYKKFVYINCDNNPILKQVFTDFNIERILRNLSAISNTAITEEDTLVVLDEIQECPKALTSLKYFCEDAPKIHIAVAGSLLGLIDHIGTGYPVGKVDSLTLYPLSFMEFLNAMGNELLASEISKRNWKELNYIHETLTEILRQYYYVGGMPEVVQSYIDNKDLKKVRSLQKQIITGYGKDISKHAPKNEIAKITMVWNSIPSQLAKENKKFVFSAVKKGGRAKEFENAIQWLINAGIVTKVNRVTNITMPLKFYEDFSAYKLFVNDLGLLGAMVNASAKDVLVGDNVFSSNKGSFTEQYIAQLFICNTESSDLFYYTNQNSTLVIDFVFQGKTVYPVEVKAETNLKSKSLSTVLSNNDSLHGLRFSMSPFIEQERLTNIPLPLANEYLKNLELLQ